MSRKDPVTAAVYEHVRSRDYWRCVAPAIPEAPRASEPCSGRIELDHVHGRGLSHRGPSRSWNLASLCNFHHGLKTRNARAWRKHLDWYLLTFEPTARTDPEAAAFLPIHTLEVSS
jgi:hypothetical protein